MSRRRSVSGAQVSGTLPIDLTAGELYYVTALVKDGGQEGRQREVAGRARNLTGSDDQA